LHFLLQSEPRNLFKERGVLKKGAEKVLVDLQAARGEGDCFPGCFVKGLDKGHFPGSVRLTD